MKEAFEKIKERLEEEKKAYSELVAIHFEQRNNRLAYVYKEKELAIKDAIDIVNQVAEEYGKDTNVHSNSLLDSLHEKILKSKFAEEVTEAEIDVLVKAKQGLNENNQGRIPCSEDMPKQLGRYIVTLKDGRSLEAIYDNISKRFIMYEHDVIARQPLPEPYKPIGE